MKIWALSAVAVAAVVAVAACGNGGTTSTTTAAAGTGGTTGTATLHVASSSHSTGVTSGTGGAGTGGAPGACGSLQYTSVAACEAVVEMNCCGELMNCDTGTACNDWVKCANACQGTAMTCDATCTACVKGCDTSKAAGYTDFKTLRTCFNQKCAAAPGCGTPVCMSGILVADKMCGDCLSKPVAMGGCCESLTACAKDMACSACLTAAMPAASCATNMLYKAASTCQDGAACGPVCAGAICDSGLGYPGRPACNYCLGQPDADAGGMGCCQEMDACKADTAANGCFNCIQGKGDQTACASNPALMAFNACSTAHCATQCM